MTCHHVQLENGASAIVCGRGLRFERCRCGRKALLLCDWKMPEGKTVRKSGTCDQPLCDRCTHSPAPDKDLCPAHAAEWHQRSWAA
jgi:hypothetical protein